MMSRKRLFKVTRVKRTRSEASFCSIPACSVQLCSGSSLDSRSRNRAIRLIESRLHDAFPVETRKRVSPNAPEQFATRRTRQREVRSCSRMWHFFGAYARAQRQARERLPLCVNESRLIVTSCMDADGTDEPVFDFIFVTGSDVERPREIRGLRCESGAIILETNR